MKRNPFVATWVAMLLGAAILAALPARAVAHCDTVDGPVVAAARDALQKNDVNRVLVWVKKADEPAIREAFRHTLAVRKLGPEARDLADRYFFETLVRLHRAGEGEPYTGLKPAGLDLGPAIPAADRALETGDLAPLTTLLGDAMRKSLDERFHDARLAKSYAVADVEAGRRYIESYVVFIHQAEAMWQAAAAFTEHDTEAAETSTGHGSH